MIFANVTDWTIPEGSVTRVTDNQSRVIWEKDIGPDYSEPFYVENITNSNETLNIKKNQTDAETLTIEYSTDKITWNTLGTTSTTALTYNLPIGSKVYLRCNANKWGRGPNYYNSITGVSKVGGNIMSLLYGSNFTGNETAFPGSTQNQFSCLFNNNTNLLSASSLLLPATTLRLYCYEYLFQSCSNLTSAPELPAMTLSTGCYEAMFYSCSSLVSAPELHATTLAQACYSQMFQNCSSLLVAPELNVGILPIQSYWCMFTNCSSLNSIKCLATDLTAYQCTYNWTSNVNSVGTFTCAQNMSQVWSRDSSGIPSGWTVIEQ